jgi:hypothetical protein
VERGVDLLAVKGILSASASHVKERQRERGREKEDDDDTWRFHAESCESFSSEALQRGDRGEIASSGELRRNGGQLARTRAARHCVLFRLNEASK